MYKIIIVAFFAMTLYGAQTIEITQEQQKNLGIKTQAASKMQYIALTPYNGQVVQSQKDTISLSSNLDALVKEIHISKFAHVKKGQKLITLKSNALLNLQSEYLESNIQNTQAELNYKRDVKLEQKGVISQKRVLESKSIYDSSMLALKIKENQLLTNGMTSEMLERLKSTKEPILTQEIYAPKSGVVYALDVNVGEYVNANKRLIEIYADATRYIEISVPASVAHNVSLGDLCEFGKHKAKIVSKSSVIDEASQSLTLRAEILNPQGVLINHIYEVKILKDVSGTVKIIKSALVFVDGKAFVFKKVATGFEVVNVAIISEGPVCYVVKSTLNAGEMLAASSTSALLGAMEEADE